MNQKLIGIILIILGIVAASFVLITKIREDKAIALLAQLQNGSCFLEDGTCLHQQSFYPYLTGWLIAASLIILGIYLTLFDRTQQQLAKHHLEISKALWLV